MVHRGVISTLERFTAFLIEHYAGRFPLWLSPVQAKLMTITEEQIEPAKKLDKKLRAAGLRIERDFRNERIGQKIRNATKEKVPYQVILGPKDVDAGTLSVRLPNGKQINGIEPEVFISKLTLEVEEKKTTSIFL